MKSLFESWRSFVNQNTVNEQLEVEPESVTNAASKIQAPDRDKKSTTSSSKAAPGGSLLEILKTIIKSKVPGHQPKRYHNMMEQRAKTHLGAFKDAAAASGIPVQILISLAYEESKFDHTVVSNADATGIMQLTPSARLEITRRAVGYTKLKNGKIRKTTKCPSNPKPGQTFCRRQVNYSKNLNKGQLQKISDQLVPHPEKNGVYTSRTPITEPEALNILAGALLLKDNLSRFKTMDKALRYYNGGKPGIRGASKNYAKHILDRAIEAGYKAK